MSDEHNQYPAENDNKPQGSPVYMVRLRSGGPPLTVAGQTKEGLLTVAWFAGDEMKTATLHPSMLLPVREEATE